MNKRSLALFATALLLISSIVHGTSSQEKNGNSKIVATVNGEPIYEKELNESIALRFNKQKKYGMQAGGLPAEVDYAIKMQLLNELIDASVLYQAAMAEKDLPSVEDEVEQRILALANTFGSKENYNELLATKNTSLEKKRAYFRKSYLVQAYFDKKGLTKPDVPEEEIKALYEQQKNSFKIPEQVKLSQVFIKIDKNAPPEEGKKAEKAAQEAKKLLMDGKKFDEVARELTEKTKLTISGGERGYIRRGVLPVAVDDIAFSIMPWKISDPIKSEFGYHILMIADKKPAAFTPYEKTRDFLLQYLETEAVRNNVLKHTRELRQKAKIEIFLKKKGNADQISSTRSQSGVSGTVYSKRVNAMT